MFKHEYDEADLSAWSRTRSHLSKIARWCRSRDLPFHLVVLPAGPQIEPIGEMRRRIVMLSGESGLIRSTRLQDETLDWCRTENVTGLDLLPVMRDHKARHPEEVLFYRSIST
ncbi:MAG: hypothetical protein R3E12_18800 [Candidatus Eisenbacteria bacterium]